ncbi:MAG: hypothetical protein QJR03_15680 [Sphaerobacter sp.]|nr:hypothetical protein [Sphaerobacter sp.]
MSRTLAWAAAGLLTAGLVVGFTPVSSQGVSCGSPYAPASAPAQSFCDEVRSLVRAPALALTLVGGAMLLGAVPWRRSGVDMRGHRTVLGRPVRRRPPRTDVD